MSTPTNPPKPEGALVARLTVRKTVVHLVSTLEVFAAPESEPRIELASRPGLSKVGPVITFPIRRTGTRGMSTVQALILACFVGAAGVGSAMYAASLRSEPSMGAP